MSQFYKAPTQENESSGQVTDLLDLAGVQFAARDGLPRDLPTSSYDLLKRSADQHANRPAIRFFETVDSHAETISTTYRELFASVTRTANFLHDLGVRQGDVIAVMLPNRPETHVALWASEATGIVMPLNPHLDARTLAGLLAAAKVSALITLSPGTALFDKALGVLAETSCVRTLLVVDDNGQSGADLLTLTASLAGVNVRRLADAAGQPDDRLISGRQLGGDETASYFCTGGTTGLPKIAVRTHGQVVANAWMAKRMLGSALTEEGVLFCGLPLFHVNAVVVTGLVPFFTGACVLLGTPEGYRAPQLVSRFWEIVARHRVTGFSAVPTLLAGLLASPVEGHDLSSLRFAVCGAAPLSAELLSRFESICGVAVSEGYGLTESACVASLNPVYGEHRAGSVGLPMPGETIRTVIVDGRGSFVRDARIGEIGLVAIAGPNVFTGYLDAGQNHDAWLDCGDGKRWLNTGDLGRLDAEGYLWLTGRAKDLIIRGGHNIDPLVIEEALYAHPSVALAAAIGRPDAYAGEVPVAFVQLRPGHVAGEADLIDHAKSLIGERAAWPKSVTVLESLPLTAVGKIHKASLRVIANEITAREALAVAGVSVLSVRGWLDEESGIMVGIVLEEAAHLGAAKEAMAPFTFAYALSLMSSEP